MRTPAIWRNGQFLSEDQARISVYDLSQTQGFSVFEMTRSFGGKTFRIHEHLKRLNDSCVSLGIPLTDPQELEYACQALVETNEQRFAADDEHRLMIVASPGAPKMYDGLSGAEAKPWVMITDFPLRRTVAGLGKFFNTGAQAFLSPIQTIENVSLPTSAKHRSRAHFHMAQSMVPFGAWAVMTDRHGYVTECPGANVMIFHNGILQYTTTNVLAGISQQYVVELAAQIGLPVQNKKFSIDDLYDAQEVFVTGTPFCMLPITQFVQKKYGEKPGFVYNALLAKWGEAVGINIAQQIQAWDTLSV